MEINQFNMIEIIENTNGAYMGYSGDYIFEKMKLNQRHDSFIFDFIKNNIKITDKCIDIGAYIGDITIPLSKSAKQVYAFEPNPNIFLALCGNLFLNSCKNVKVFDFVCSDENCNFDFGANDTTGNLASTSFKKNDLGNIKAARIDSIIESEINFIKCDAEGGDLNALMGCEKIIKESKPNILFEYHSELSIKNYNKKLTDYYDFFYKLGYKLYDINGSDYLAKYE